MRALSSITVAALLATALYASPADAFRCGSRIVVEGDDISHVHHICGEPSTVQHWTEVRVRPVYYSWHNDYRHRYRRITRLPVEIQVEEWTYNLGSRRFMRRLRFENGVLVDIRELRYGY